MRKQNSEFQAEFISEAGNQLKNNDYFGYVELDEYACYVIADGITDTAEAEAARLAIETVILHFQAGPSISAHALRRWLREANRVLLEKESYKSLKASVVVVVTDYQKIRYGYAGNTRMRMYRGGSVYLQTKDMSLAREMADRNQIALDQVEKHEERNNLYSYLGQKGFRPFISKKIKLIETDIIALYTRGFWENVDEAELDEVFEEAGNEAGSSLDDAEELLLSRQPENLDNYTLAAIFINKVYQNPQKRKKIKKIIIIAVTIAVLIAVLCTVLWFLHKRKLKNIADMNDHYTNTIEYINTDNYVRAKEECEEAQKLSEKVRDDAMKKRLQKYLMVIETVILADESYQEKDYEKAKEYLLTAREQAKEADNLGKEYIEQRLGIINDYLTVRDCLELGDVLLESGNFAGAEGKYLEAKKLALDIHDEDGREKAMKALEDLYQKQKDAQEEEEKEAKEQAEEEIAAAEMVASGDKACMEGDYAGARVYYTMAVEKYKELEQPDNQNMAQGKLDAVNQKIAESEQDKAAAAFCESQGAALKESGDYWGAKAQYLQAKDIHQRLGNTGDVERIAGIISQLDGLIQEAEAKKEAEQQKEKEKKSES